MKPILKLGNITSKVPKDFYRLCFFFGGKNHFSSSVTRCSRCRQLCWLGSAASKFDNLHRKFYSFIYFFAFNYFYFLVFFRRRGPRKIFGVLPARTKRGFQIFRLRWTFFHCGGFWKPLNFRNLSNNRQIYGKTNPKIFLPAAVNFTKSPRSKWGGPKTYLDPPPLTGYAGCHP